MFIEAIEKAAGYTRAVHSIIRSYGGKQITPSAATLFFVNREGCAITCKHVAEMLMSADHINQQYVSFKKERDHIKNDPKYNQALKGLELKYQLNAQSPIQIKNNFVDCVDAMSGFDVMLHPTLDLAIIRFKGYQTLHYKEHAIFVKEESRIQAGKFLCRLGFPFPEFSNFHFNEAQDDIEWNNQGVNVSPRFPIEGMITRFLADPTHNVYGIEMSTPGLRGQSGGPLFDANGLLYGMQFSTKHLHLGFDIVDKDLMVDGLIKKVSDYSFIHLGQCIHISVIKTFLQQHNIPYHES
jgi:hypothetical protein